jgi:hypothetical protein
MSVRVLVIPEDPTLDQFVLKPIVERIFKELKCPAKIDLLRDPHLEGVAQALDKSMIEEVLERYPMIDLFLLVVDRDCDANRQQAVDARVRDAASLGRDLLGCLAIEEVEVWALAVHRRELGGKWSDVRKHCNPKEAYFDPFVKQRGWHAATGRGRVDVMRGLRGNWKSLKAVCGEIGEFQDAIAAWLKSRGC